MGKIASYKATATCNKEFQDSTPFLLSMFQAWGKSPIIGNLIRRQSKLIGFGIVIGFGWNAQKYAVSVPIPLKP